MLFAIVSRGKKFGTRLFRHRFLPCKRLFSSDERRGRPPPSRSNKPGIRPWLEQGLLGRTFRTEAGRPTAYRAESFTRCASPELDAQIKKADRGRDPAGRIIAYFLIHPP